VKSINLNFQKVKCLDCVSYRPSGVTKGTQHESAWVFLFRMRSKVLLISKGKGKARQLQSSWGSMLGMPNAQTDHAQHNPLEGKARQLQSSWGSMLGMPNAQTDHAQHNPLKKKNPKTKKKFGLI
jgi:hypothetical protein